MSLKAKIISAVVAIVFVVALIGVGVWAAETASVTLGGSVSFSATNVYCDISGEITNLKGEAPVLDTLKFDASSTEGPTEGDVSTWAGNALNFKKSGQAVVYTITIKNNSTTNVIKVQLEDTAAATAGLTKTIAFDSNEYDSGDLVEIPANTTKSFTITFSLTSKDDSISNANYSFALSLTDPSYTA